MSGILLTAYSGAILGPIAKVLGWVMNGIYMAMYNLFGIEDVALSIILLTAVIYLCLLPLTIKQQKFSKMTQIMQPEIQAIQNKYKNKKDQASMQAMQQETQLVYEKYGVSPAGSCVQMLIQMPILFALYRVFYNVPAYIVSVKNQFSGLVDTISATSGFQDTMTQIMKDYKLNVSVDFTTTDTSALKNYIVDVLYKLPKSGWENLTDYFSNVGSEVDTLTPHMNKFNYFFGLNVSDTPLNVIKTSFASHAWLILVAALLIPVISYLTQMLNIKLMPQAGSNGNDQMAQQMKTMNLMMPLFSFVMCFTVPVGLGVYWIAGAVCRSVQQLFINKYFQNLDMDDVIRKNQEKAKKKREKMGIAQNQIRDAAKISTKKIDSTAESNKMSSAQKELELEKAAAKKANAKAGSMAAKANMVRDFNEKNSRK
ncbi:MAG: YidC/Oxa1 family membrane protein insertase [Roseburia porci]|uniref:YidC/Oxa1 family membrane protein insertase n=1 Tax=Roseburia porci TaxID=2605790 RepID=UPI0012B3CCBB|nr:YidC/Oxa1 family membrane protein insertase [Roseburia porci]MDD6742472.1 YidC/Oxa1 family membrane protein insertase [Roseburia porci]